MAQTQTFATPEQLRDPDFMPPRGQANPRGIQLVPAVFVSNVTPAIIAAAAPLPSPSACATSIGE